MAEEMAPETQPAAEAPERSTAAEQEFDPYGMSTDDLRTKIESKLYGEEPTEEVDAAGAEEAPSADEASPEQTAVADDAEAEDTDNVPSEAEELRAALEVQQAQAKHFESLLRSRGGEDGFFKSKAAQLESEIAALRSQLEGRGDDDFVEPASPARRESKPSRSRTSDASTTYLVGMAIKDAANSFLSNTPGAVKEVDGRMVVDADLQAALSEVMSGNATAIVESTDPIAAQAAVNSALSAAWGKVDLKRKQDNLAEITRRRGEQGKRLTNKKRASAASSTGSPTVRVRNKSVDPYSMPIEELRKLAEAESGGG